MSYNRWGATEAMVLRVFATAGYTPAADDFGGSLAIADELDGATFQIAQALPLAFLNQIEHPDLERIVSRAASGQNLASLGFGPAVAGTVHIWTGPPQAFASRPMLLTDPWNRGGGWAFNTGPGVQATPTGAVVELAEDKFSVAGQVVSLVDALNRSDLVFASYDVNTSDATFSIPSMADMAAKGAAFLLGSKVYPQASSEWAYVARLGEEWADYLAQVAAGKLVPAELRAKQWWQEPDKAQDGSIGSVRRYRT
jgi:hypothetical protein